MTELFNDDNKPTGDNQNPQENNANKTPDFTDLLAGIKNERGEQKFKSVEDLINGYTASQEFIGTLKGEKSTVESQLQELTGKVKSQEELEALLQTKKEPEVPPAPSTPAGLQQEDVLALLEQREQQAIATSNVKQVKDAVKAAKVDLAEAVQKAGISKEFAEEMAAKHPEQFLKLIDVDKPAAPPASLSGSTDTSVFNKEVPSKPKTIMRSTKTSDVVDAWKAAGERSMAKLEEQGQI